MPGSQKFIHSGLALIILTGSGCAGNGLRNIFSRDETAGYKTLAEIEAEAEREEAQPKSRFASWSPFSGRNSTNPESGSAKPGTADSIAKSNESATPGSFWKNPFRRQETVETDPFLANGSPEEQSFAEKSASPTRRNSGESEKSTRSAVTSTEKQDSGDSLLSTASATTSEDAARVKTVSETHQVATDTNGEFAGTDPLIDRFEQHFLKNTSEAVTSVDETSPLIVAGKDKANAASRVIKKPDTQATSGDRLSEFEAMLTQRKTDAVQRLRDKSQQESSEKGLTEPDDAFFSPEPDPASQRNSKIQSAATRVSSAADDFDSLFTSTSTNVASKSRDFAREFQPGRSETDQRVTSGRGIDAADDIRVADAASLFGSSELSENSGKAPQRRSVALGGWSSDTADDADAWAHSQIPSSRLATNPSEPVADSESRTGWMPIHFESSEPHIPQAVINDPPDTTGQFAAAGSQRKSSNTRVQRSSQSSVLAPTPPQSRENDAFLNSTFTVSSSGSTRAGNFTPPSGTQDPHFSQSTEAAPDHVSVSSAVSRGRKSATNGYTILGLIKVRNALLLLGGVIVVALLFAPGRKKSTETTPLAGQG